MRAALARIVGAPPAHYCVWCDGAGLVRSVALDTRTNTKSLGGVALGAPRSDAERLLGEPVKQGNGWATFAHAGLHLRLGYDSGGAVSSFTLLRAE